MQKYLKMVQTKNIKKNRSKVTKINLFLPRVWNLNNGSNKKYETKLF